MLCVFPGWSFEIGLSVGLHRRHLLHVLGGLFGQNAYGVVKSHDPDYAALCIHDGYRYEPIFAKELGGILSVIRRVDGNIVSQDERRDGLLAPVREQVLCRHNA